MILVNDRANHRGEADELETFGKTAGPGDAGIPFVQIKAEVADRWFTAAGKNLKEIQDGDRQGSEAAIFCLLDAALGVEANWTWSVRREVASTTWSDTLPGRDV